MSDQFLGEIRIVPLNYAPAGWAFCNGQALSLAQNTALFSLLGTTYGGDGRSTFNLPNLQGSVPIHTGGSGPGPGLSTYLLGQTGGAQTETLTSAQLPAHAHSPRGYAEAATATTPGGNVLAAPPGNPRHPAGLYKTGPLTTPVSLDPTVIGSTGGSQPHNNVQPYLVLNFIIALQGIYPQRP